MIQIRPANERGHAQHGWLDSWHSFSFGGYHDPAHVHFGDLRVINEDRVDPAQGFGAHSHANMEIVSYVLGGALAHKDSMGNGSTIRPGDVQRLSAGTGMTHSEFNHSPTEPVHFLQIWLLPNVTGIAPSYQEKHFDDADKRGRLCLIAAPDGADGAITIHANARVHAASVDGDERIEFAIPSQHLVYLHVARGSVVVNGQALVAGDALKFSDEPTVIIEQGQAAEVLLFDLF